MYKLFLTFHYLRTRLIAYFAICAVALCVMMVLVVMSVMGGWLDQVKQRARGLLGDVIVDNGNYAGFPLYDEFIEEISEWPQIEAATPVIYTYGLMRIRTSQFEKTDPTSVVGVRLDEVVKVNAFGRSLFYEKYYPGTTHLGEVRMPQVGIDAAGEPVRLADGREVQPIVLPEPYQAALERARQAALAETGRPLEVTETVDSGLSQELRAVGLPPIPGFYDYNFETGEPRLVGDPLPGVIIGRDIVASRNSDGTYEHWFPRGTEVTLTLWAASLAGSVDPLPKKQSFRYIDDSRTGVYEIDSKHVYCDFDLVQRIVEMGAAERVDADGNVIGRWAPRCSQIQIKLAPGASAGELTSRLTDTYVGLLSDPRFENLSESERKLVLRVKALTWEQSQAHIIGPVEKERALVTVLFGIVSLVAVALILCILYMIVLQKTRDVGIIKSLGGSSGGVAMIFVHYGAAVGLIGAVLGLIGGTLFVTYINDIQDFLISIDPRLRVWDLQVYSFDRIPSEVNPLEAAAIGLIAVAAATAGSLAAALRAGYMQPVEALGYE